MKSNEIILKSREISKSKRHNVFTEEVNKIVLISNDHKRMQSTDSVEIYSCGTNNDLVCEKEKIKCNNIIKRHKND